MPDRNLVTKKVIPTLNTITPVSIKDDNTESPNEPPVPTKNIVIRAIKVGKRPLHGTKLFVSMASSRSRGESIIRHPTTPAALQPKPMHMGFF